MKAPTLIVLGCWCVMSCLGCAVMTVGEMDNALPQGRGTLRIGAGAEAPFTKKFGQDTVATKKDLRVGDWAGKAYLRYGLTEGMDLTTTLWYSNAPGYGIRATVKQSMSLSPTFTIALYGSFQHFWTNNEVQEVEGARNTYNRSISGLTVGGVGSLLLSRRSGSLSNDAFSFGAKFTVNHATIDRETIYYLPPVGSPPPSEQVSTRDYYYVAMPYAGLSVGSAKESTFYLELQLPLAIYDDFKSVGPFYGQLSAGIMVRLF